MRILHVVPTYLPARRYGGPIVAVHGLCKALVARGHEVDVFTTNVDGEGTLDVPVAAPVPLDGVRVHYFPSTLRRIYFSPAMGRAFQHGGYDLIHSHAIYLWPGTAASRAARKQANPHVI
jgi:glycosyltransferase involved in cell wall biosynthesis